MNYNLHTKTQSYAVATYTVARNSGKYQYRLQLSQVLD